MKSTVLKNIYSREKSLFYFCMWNDSDRMGYKNFLDYKVKHNLFLLPFRQERGSVWYAQDELDLIDKALNKQVTKKSFQKKILDTLEINWNHIFPVLSGEKHIKNSSDLAKYYKHLITWWSAMNTVLYVPENKNADLVFKQKILAIREKGEKFTERMDKIFLEFWTKFGQKYKHLGLYLTPKEAIKILNNKINKKELHLIGQRKNGCLMLNEKMFLFKDLEKILKRKKITLFQDKNTGQENLNLIKGTIAQKGLVQGKVKIVLLKMEGVKVDQNDILVTSMTNPDYVPFMKIAGAIVTDEGGITCHAAIVARELKKPCIIGTKIATKVLKDGDLVEVDADTGVVKVLKRAK